MGLRLYLGLSRRKLRQILILKVSYTIHQKETSLRPQAQLVFRSFYLTKEVSKFKCKI